MSSSVSTTEYQELDALGRVKRHRQITDWYEFPFQYSYDLAGNLATQTNLSGRVFTRCYDAANRLIRIDGQKPQEVLKTHVSSITYAPHGPIQVMKFGNDRWEHRNYNSRLQLSELGLGTTGTDSSTFRSTYTYEQLPGLKNNGNVLSQQIADYSGRNATYSYTHDALNRLKTTATPTVSQNLIYDRYGNAADTLNTTTGAPISLSEYNAAKNQLNSAPATDHYDAAGNYTTAIRFTNGTSTFDAEGRPVEYNNPASSADFFTKPPRGRWRDRQAPHPRRCHRTSRGFYSRH